jgi:hypothetical protein
MKQTGQNHHGDSNDSSVFDDGDSAQGDLGGGSFHGTSYRPIGGGDTVPPGTTELRLAPADFTTQPVGSDPNPRTISANIAGFNGFATPLRTRRTRHGSTFWASLSTMTSTRRC